MGLLFRSSDYREWEKVSFNEFLRKGVLKLLISSPKLAEMDFLVPRCFSENFTRKSFRIVKWEYSEQSCLDSKSVQSACNFGSKITCFCTDRTERPPLVFEELNASPKWYKHFIFDTNDDNTTSYNCYCSKRDRNVTYKCICDQYERQSRVFISTVQPRTDY